MWNDFTQHSRTTRRNRRIRPKGGHVKRQDYLQEELDAVAAIDKEHRELVCHGLELLLATIATEQGDILRRVDIEGEEIATVANALGISLRDVTENRRRGWQALKTRLEEMRMMDG